MITDKVTIKNITLKNRIAIPPMVCFYWHGENWSVSEKNLTHYRELAEGGAGLIIVEATAITKRSRLHEEELGLWEDSQIEGFKKITDVIHANGAKTFIQLVHAGGNGIDENADTPDTMTKDRIDATRNDFVQAAIRAKKAGFDGVELHGCHGYLISWFFNSRNNTRTDEYGKDKSLFAREILQDVKKACGDDFIVGIRLGAFEPYLQDGLEHAKAIAPFTDFIDVSYGGNCNGEAPEGFPCSQAVYGASCIKKELPQMPVFGVHNINSREDVIAALETGIDVVDVGKASLVDPAFANHVINNEPAGKCLHCNNYCRWNPPEMGNPKLRCPGADKWNKTQTK